MFETETEQMKEEKRSRTMLVLGGIGALVLAGVIVFLAQSKRATTNTGTPQIPGGMQVRLEGALRAGSPEFDDYKNKITLENKEMLAAQNLTGMTRFMVNLRVTNRGDKAITGLELMAKVLDLEQKIVAQNTNRPIPNSRKAPLQPGETIRVSLVVDTPAKITEGDVSDIIPEISGLKF